MPSQLTIPIIDPLGIIVDLPNSLFPTAQNAERWEIVRGKGGELQGGIVHREIKY